jgi:hypothetical protein
MPTYPNRCQHIKVNGTQCGCPALRRNRFCYFHKRHHEERVQLNRDRARHRSASIDLPVLEDANSIQVSLMQIMRLLVAGQLDGKTAGLLLYALQTATLNLARTSFEPRMHNVVLDPASVRDTPLGAHIWEDDDFITDQEREEEEEETMRAEALAEVQRKAKKKVESERWAEAEAQRLMEEGAREREAARQVAARNAETLRKLEAQSHETPEGTIQAVAEDLHPAVAITPAGRAVIPTQTTHTTRKRPPARVKMSDLNLDEVRKQVREQIRQALPEIVARFRQKNAGSSG